MPEPVAAPAPVNWTRTSAQESAWEPEAASSPYTPTEGPNDAPEAGGDGSATAGPPPLKEVQFAIVGYTPTASDAIPLLADPDWTVWGMNNLHTQELWKDRVAQFDEWFDLHPVADIRQDPAHVAWLASGSHGVPVWTWEPQEDWPTTKRLPKEELTGHLGRYFTNTVSWQLGLALIRMMRFSQDGRAPAGAKIAIYGIDMATSSEYAVQRPSVEYLLGVATGLGVEVILPLRSDLLKCAQLYGEEGGAFRAMLDERTEVLQRQLAEYQQAVSHYTALLHGCQGALEQVNYIKGVWTQPNVDRNAPQNQPAQDGQGPSTT